MRVILCPGAHDPSLTDRFLAGMQQTESGGVWSQLPQILPIRGGVPLCPFQILGDLKQQPRSEPLVFVGFSAGVMSAVGAALLGQQQGHRIQALIALDGWGVPRWGNFPWYRLSHDYFTHWSSGLLGVGDTSFYADPSVDHLELWRSPHTTWGWQIAPRRNLPGTPLRRLTAAQFLIDVLWQGHPTEPNPCIVV